MNKLKQFYYYLLDSSGCTAPTGIFYKLYELLAGKLTCLCCIFWRGFSIGALTLVLLSIIYGIVS